MRKIIFTIFTLFIITISSNYGQSTPIDRGMRAITQNAIKAQLGFLASDWTEGRMAGEKGESLSADYIASMLQLYGVEPGGDNYQRRIRNIIHNGDERSYFQNFVLLKTIAGDEQILKVKSTESKMLKTSNFTYNVDFLIRPSYPGIEIEAPVVFAGYGIINNKLRYNDFDKLDVKGKFVLRIAGIPQFMRESLDQGAYLSLISEMESKLKTMGAIGIIAFNPMVTVVGNPNIKEFENMSPSELAPRPGNPSARYSIPGKTIPKDLIRISVSVKTANEIINGSGISIDDYIKKADANEMYPMPVLANKNIYLKTSVSVSQVAVRNIIGIIEGNNPEQVIVLGAHYDHMGINNGYIWNGADDNGSGTVGVMTLAKAIMETGVKPEKTIIIALWTAEEEGLLGSRYWIKNPTIPLDNVKLNVNFDMISRYISEDDPKKVIMTYNSTYPVFKDMTMANLSKHDIDLIVNYQPSTDPPGGTDHRSFVEAGIPIMRFKPGHRKEYHTPMDELDTVDWDIMEKIIKISFANVWDLANNDW